MPRRRGPRPPPLADRDLAEEVLYLHSLWRRGPPAPAPATAPIPSRSGRRKAIKRKHRSLERAAAEPNDAGSELPLAPSPSAYRETLPDASASSPAKPTQATLPSPGSPAQREDFRSAEVELSNRGAAPSRSARRKANKRKRRRLEHGAAEHQDTGSEWHLAPSPPTSPKAWPDASTSSSPAKPASAPPSPGSLAQREALRAAEEFFSNGGSDGDDDEGSESESDEEEAAGFFTGMFERDAALRGHYERRWEEGQFPCIACAGRKARKGKTRRFRGCVGLVQHARAATRYGRPGAHRALAAVICRVLGWDIERLPSIVIDPRGTLGQALATEATADAQQAKENDDTMDNNGLSSNENGQKEDVEAGMKVSSGDGDEETNEQGISKKAAKMDDVDEIGMLNCEDESKNKVLGHETVQEEDIVKTGMEDSRTTDGEKEANELEDSKVSAEKEDMEEIGPLNCEDILNDGHCNETVQEVNARKDDSLSQDKKGEVHEQDIAKESAEKEIYAHESTKEHAKNADDTDDTRLGNNSSTVLPSSSSQEENVGANKAQHTDKTT